MFEDEDTRQFYEKFPDLRAIIPGVSLVPEIKSVEALPCFAISCSDP